MKISFKSVFFLVVLVGFFKVGYCQKATTFFPQKIKEVYYRKTKDGSVDKQTGTLFSIQFEKKISSSILLQKVYFHNQEANFQTKTKNTYVAYFPRRMNRQDYVMDSDSLKEYGNVPPVLSRSKFTLKENEAVLFFLKNGNPYYYKLGNVKELPMIVYPSMNKPKN